MNQVFRTAEERLDAILAAAPDGILLCDGDGRIVLANQQAGRMFGYEASELLGQFVELLIPARLRPGHVKERNAYIANPLPRPMGAGRDLVALCKDGSELPVEISLAPVIAEGGVLIVNIVRDVSERRRLQAELKKRNDELMQADVRKDEFLALLSHELRNPLAPIRTAVDVLRQTRCEEPDVSWATDVIERQVDHLTRLVDDLLDVSRITRGKIRLKRERVALSAVMASAVETTRPWIEARNHLLDVQLPPEEVWIDGDSLRLAQVVANLLNNAAKYSDEGSRISVSARVADASTAGPELEIRVRDRGVGIAPEFLPHIFDIFSQADRSLDRSHGGLGIGLTLVKSLVEMHGGSVHAESPGVGQGSDFVVRLPIATGAVPFSVPALPAVAAGQARFRILVADDNVDFAESVARLLKRRGHEVLVAHDGEVALERAREFLPEVAIVDIGLPGMNGYDLARGLRATPELASMLIIAVSGYGRDEDRARARDAGIDEHMTKPIQIDAITQILARSRPSSTPA